MTFFEDMYRAKIGEGSYTHIDRYRDFRAALVDGNATPEQAQRVLWQIMEMCGLHNLSADLTGRETAALETYFYEGQRNVGIRIYAILNTIPENDDHEDDGGS